VMLILDQCVSATGWTIQADATENLSDTVTSTTERQVTGGSALEFDKKNGSGSFIGGAYRSLKPTYGTDVFNPQLVGCVKPYDRICWIIYISGLSDVAYSFVRLGTGASDYLEWRYGDTSHTAGAFSHCHAKIAECYCTGTGCGDWSAVDYLMVGVFFDGEDDALADIAVDLIYIESARAFDFGD